jgi:AcrR family transcriptional regulator
MARTVKPEEHAAKRNDILDVTQRLVVTKGYERMTIQDILAALRMSSGAFYHYFGSKPDVLDALVDRIREQSSAPLLNIVRDPKLSATEKLRDFFSSLDQLRAENKAAVIALLQAWYSDDNAIVRQKVEAAMLAWQAPLISEIARQGAREGVFSTPFPDQAGGIVLSLSQALGAAHAKLMLAFVRQPDEQHFSKEVLALHTAYVDAIERVLGAPSGTLRRADAGAVAFWIRAMRDDAAPPN